MPSKWRFMMFFYDSLVGLRFGRPHNWVAGVDYAHMPPPMSTPHLSFSPLLLLHVSKLGPERGGNSQNFTPSHAPLRQLFPHPRTA